MNNKKFSYFVTSCIVVSVFLLSSMNIGFAKERSRLDDTHDSGDQSIVDWFIEANLKREVSFYFQTRMLGLRGVELQRFRIMENQKFLAEHPYLSPYALDADSVVVNYNPFSIFIGRLTLSNLEVTNPEIQFAIDDRLRTNFDDLIEVQRKNRFTNWIRVHKLLVHDARINIYSELIFSRYQEYYLEDIDVDVRNIIKGRVADVKVRALTPGAEEQNIFVDGTVGPIVSIARIEESPADLKVSVNDAPLNIKEIAHIPDSIEDHERLKQIIALPESGLGNLRFILKGDAYEGLDANGKIDLTDIVLSSLDDEMKSPLFDIHIVEEARVILEDSRIDVNKLDIDLTGNPINIQGKLTDVLERNIGAEINVTSKSGLNLPSLHQIYPFYERVSKIKPTKGDIHFDLNATGKLIDGFTVDGPIDLHNLQLTNSDETITGTELKIDIDLDKEIMLKADNGSLDIDDLAINLGESLINLTVKATEILGVDRDIRAGLSTDLLNITELHNFFPFFDHLIPKDVRFDGSLAFKSNIQTNLLKTSVAGNADLTNFSFALDDFVKKKKGSTLTADYSAKLDLEIIHKAKIDIVFKDGIIDSPEIYMGALQFLLKGSAKSGEGKALLNKAAGKQMSFDASNSTIRYKEDYTIDAEFDVRDIVTPSGHLMDIEGAGQVDISTYKIDAEGKIILDDALAKQVLMLNHGATSFASSKYGGKKLVVPFTAKGTLTDPKYNFGF